jgi:hypothetical protein
MDDLARVHQLIYIDENNYQNTARMKKIIFLVFIFSIGNELSLIAQKNKYKYDNYAAHYIGFLFSADLAYNQKDKLFNAYFERKLSVGISFTNRNADFIFYTGFGFKGWKLSLTTPLFSSQFTNDLNQSYHTVSGNLGDSLVAISVYGATQNKKDFHEGGFYAGYVEAGFILTHFKVRPSISFFTGYEEYVLFTPVAHYFDSPNTDSYSEWISMNSRFQEVKIGLDILGIFTDQLPATLDLNVGYKWLNYKNISYGGGKNGTPLSTYTNDQMAEKYNLAQKFTFGINFRWWTNWEW